MQTDEHARFTNLVRPQGFIPILRTETPDDAIKTGFALLEAGVNVVELTRSTPGVEIAVQELTSAGLVVGVGTIRHPDEVDRVVEAGAEFVVSYFTPDGFIARSLKHSIVPVPGVQTPTEMQAAADAGALILKIFPAWQSQPRIIADVRPLVKGVEFIPTGGTDGEIGRAWLDAGALAIGVGRALGTSSSVGAAEVTRRAIELNKQFGRRKG